MTNTDGDVVWLADYEAYGNTAKVVWREEKLESLQVAKEYLQPLRFQGQYYDEETGLHYNRFRYFDPDLGMFTTRDPIGLLGGSNVFQYAPNPVGWVDPFGLKKTPTRTLQKNWLEYVGQSHTNSDIHHGFPEEFADRFRDIADIDVNNPKYYYNLPKSKHTKKPGIHTNSSRSGKNWNKVWKGILDQVESMDLTKEQAKELLEQQLRALARKERISKHNAKAVRNANKCRRG